MEIVNQASGKNHHLFAADLNLGEFDHKYHGPAET